MKSLESYCLYTAAKLLVYLRKEKKMSQRWNWIRKELQMDTSTWRKGRNICPSVALKYSQLPFSLSVWPYVPPHFSSGIGSEQHHLVVLIGIGPDWIDSKERKRLVCGETYPASKAWEKIKLSHQGGSVLCGHLESLFFKRTLNLQCRGWAEQIIQIRWPKKTKRAEDLEQRKQPSTELDHWSTYIKKSFTTPSIRGPLPGLNCSLCVFLFLLMLKQFTLNTAWLTTLAWMGVISSHDTAWGFREIRGMPENNNIICLAPVGVLLSALTAWAPGWLIWLP